MEITKKTLTEAQANALSELMNGEHGEAIQTYADNKFRAGQGAGMVGGVIYAGVGALMVSLVIKTAKATWDLGKEFVKFVKES